MLSTHIYDTSIGFDQSNENKDDMEFGASLLDLKDNDTLLVIVSASYNDDKSWLQNLYTKRFFMTRKLD